MKKILFKMHVSLLIQLLVFLFTACGDSSDSTTEKEEEKSVDVANTIIGYWHRFTLSNDLSSYTFLSFGGNNSYAMFLDDDNFSSGTYKVNGSEILLKDGYDDSSKTITVTELSDTKIKVKIENKTYTGEKDSREAIDLQNILIGKTYNSLLGDSKITTTFNTRYSAMRVLTKSMTKKYYIYWQYIYNGKNVYVKNFQSPNEQHPTIGGWNTYEEGKVYIWDITIKDSFIERMVKIDQTQY